MRKLTATKVAQHLDITVVTLTNWYTWYNNDKYVKPANTPELPKYEQVHERAARYWNESDLHKLEKFKEWVPKGRNGVMGQLNARFWGDYGKKRLKKQSERIKNDK